MTTWTSEGTASTSNTPLTTSSMEVGNIKIDGINIGRISDTDLMSLASGALTVNGTITATGSITGTLATAAQGNVTSLGTLTALQVDNININGNTLSTTDTNGDMIFDTNGTGNYQFKTDGGSGTVLELICTDSDGTNIHFLNSTTGTTPDTDGWRFGIDGSENLVIYNEELNTNPFWINDSNDAINMSSGVLNVGTNTSVQGIITVNQDSTGSTLPGTINLKQVDDGNGFIWVDNDGKLRVHTSTPTAHNDGTIVGTQS